MKLTMADSGMPELTPQEGVLLIGFRKLSEVERCELARFIQDLAEQETVKASARPHLRLVSGARREKRGTATELAPCKISGGACKPGPNARQ